MLTETFAVSNVFLMFIPGEISFVTCCCRMLSVLLSLSWQVVDQNPRIGLLIASPVEIIAQGRLVKVEYSTGTIKHQPPNHQIPPIQ